MRRYLPVIVAVFLIAAIFGTYRAYSIPAEVEERFELLNYEHIGEFDYTAYQTASYLFGDLPLANGPQTSETPEAPPSALKYPSEITDMFDITFNYQLVPDRPVRKIHEQVEVKTVLRKPGGAPEEVILVPSSNYTGSFNLAFSLAASELALSPTTTITADIYATIETGTGPIFESFTQSLTIRSTGPLLVVDRNLDKTQQASFGELTYEQTGQFDYAVRLKPESIYGAIVLRPPLPPSQPEEPSTDLMSDSTLGPDDTIYNRLFKSADLTFSYRLESNNPVNQMTGQVEINAILENPGVWRKTFTLVPATEKIGNFTVGFPLNTDNFSLFRNVYTTIQGETGVSVPHTLTIQADVHAIAKTDFGIIDEVFRQSLSTTLGGDTLVWKEKLVKSQPGAINTVRLVPNPDKHFGLTVPMARNLSIIVSSVIFILLLYLVVRGVWFKPRDASPVEKMEKKAMQARKQHKNVILDVDKLPDTKKVEVVPFSSLDELVSAADALLKPVLHRAEAERHTYCVIDGTVRYQYLLTINENEQGSNEQNT